MDGYREQQTLDRLPADFALLHRIIRHALEALELMLARYTSVFVGRQNCMILLARSPAAGLPIIAESGYNAVFEKLAGLCAKRCEGYVFGSMQVGSYIFSMKELLAKSSNADNILEEVINE
jgi:hypothetical protein